MSVQDILARMMQGNALESRLREEARVAANEEVARLRSELADAKAALSKASDLLAISRRAFEDVQSTIEQANAQSKVVGARQ